MKPVQGLCVCVCRHLLLRVVINKIYELLHLLPAIIEEHDVQNNKKERKKARQGGSTEGCDDDDTSCYEMNATHQMMIMTMMMQ